MCRQLTSAVCEMDEPHYFDHIISLPEINQFLIESEKPHCMNCDIIEEKPINWCPHKFNIYYMH
jgi:hypothetical protein